MKGMHELGVVSALILDDNPFDRRRLARIATNSSIDFVLKEAGSLEDAGTLLEHEKFDVIYVDLNIGTELGLSFLPAVRNHRVNAHARLIMISGTTDISMALDAMRAGFSDFINKDELDDTAFERATINAVKQLYLTRSADNAEAASKSMETVLNTFAGICLNEVRPLLARLRRQVRQVKTRDGRDSANFPELLEIEATCGRIEDFFTDLNGMAEDQQLSAVVSDPNNATRQMGATNGKQPEQEPAQMVQPKKPKPPSLFGKRQ